MNKNMFINIGQKLKNIRHDLGMNQNELAEELTAYCKNEKVKYSVKSEKKKENVITFTQVDISNIENNGSIIKEKIYIILSYFNKKHNVNLNYVFNDIPENLMFNYEILLT